MSSFSLASALGIIAGWEERAFAQSQIVPDNTLGAETSQVVPNFNGLPVEVINGGAVRGANLFHSFGEFNVAEGRGAYFFSPSTAVQNILARVTGSNPSQILGTLGTFGNSNPNLFLINPNGILFGSDASLDMAGSFVATTASGLQFENRGEFSATNPHSPSPLLTTAPSAFFFTTSANQGGIINQSRVTQTVVGTPTDGLQVPNGQTLLLLGGNVTNDDGRLIARGGRVEIGAVIGPGSVELNANGSLSVADGMQRADVVFTNRASANRSGIDVRYGNGGYIGITSGNISVFSGSQLRAGIASGLGTPESQGGDITVNATGEIRMTGDDSRMANDVRPNAIGKAGNLTIATHSLVVTDGAQLSASTFGIGDAGNVVIAADRVAFSGTRADEQGVSAAFTRVEQGARGKGGNVLISTNVLEVTNGAALVTTTDGIGDAGNIAIAARDRVSFNGISAGKRFASAAFSYVSLGARGKGGNVQISTNSLDVTNGAVLSAYTAGIGDAGNVQISANTLEVTNGAQLGAFTEGTGDAGKIVVNAAKTVNITGTTPLTGRSSGLFTSTSSAGKGGDIIVNTQAFRLADGAVLDADAEADNRSGNITVNAAKVDIFNGGQMLATTQGDGRAGNITVNATQRVTLAGIDPTFTARLAQFGRRVAPLTPNSGIFVRSQASGGAGDITITAPNLRLDQGTLSAESATVDGGNINLSVQDILLLRHGSLISATAGKAQAGGDGGNIKTDSPFIVAVPTENSDITANAFTGRGGNINISTQGVFGIKFRPRQTPWSDITASSQFGLQGTVQINTPGVDPTLGLANLSANVADVSDQIAQTCSTGGGKVAQNEFIVTGRGGLPDNPSDTLSSDAVWTDLRNPSAVSSHRGEEPVAARAVTPQPPLVEANGWVMNEKGDLVLTASAPTITPLSPRPMPSPCHVSQTSRE
jgi:filamentous hemagglutinin family protein